MFFFILPPDGKSIRKCAKMSASILNNILESEEPRSTQRRPQAMIRPAISPVCTCISNWFHLVPLDELDDCILGISVSPYQGNSLNMPSQARTKEFLFKPAEEQNPRLTTGLPPVYPRFITGTKSALRSWMPTSRSTLICLCKPFSSQGCPGIRIYKTDGGTKPVVDHRFIRGLSPGQKALFVPGC